MVDPGEGYRLLEDGELLRYDDEFHTGAKYWVGVDFTAWGSRYRRKIEMNEINYTFEGVRPLIRYGGSVWRQLAVGETRQEGDIYRDTYLNIELTSRQDIVCYDHCDTYRRIDTVEIEGVTHYRLTAGTLKHGDRHHGAWWNNAKIGSDVCDSGYIYYRPIHNVPSKPKDLALDAAAYIAHLEAKLEKLLK